MFVHVLLLLHSVLAVESGVAGDGDGYKQGYHMRAKSLHLT